MNQGQRMSANVNGLVAFPILAIAKGPLSRRAPTIFRQVFLISTFVGQLILVCVGNTYRESHGLTLRLLTRIDFLFYRTVSSLFICDGCQVSVIELNCVVVRRPSSGNSRDQGRLSTVNTLDY
jgi:hypothetical protein